MAKNNLKKIGVFSTLVSAAFAASNFATTPQNENLYILHPDTNAKKTPTLSTTDHGGGCCCSVCTVPVKEISEK